MTDVLESGPTGEAAEGRGRGMGLSVVIPVYHECENAVKVYERFVADADLFQEMIFVWDCDDDPTIPFLVTLQGRDARVISLQNTLGRGVLNALRSGIAAARGSAILVAMGDLSDDLRVVPTLWDQWKAGAWVACPSRYMPGGQMSGGPIIKTALSRMAGLSLYWTGALPVRDPTNNFKLYDAEFLKSITIESARGFELALELTVKAHELGGAIVETPALGQERIAGESKFQLIRWLPGYLRWYFRALAHRFGLRRRPNRAAASPPVKRS